MAKFFCEFEGVRGRVMKLYDNKVIIITNATFGSLITGNVSDGEKTIFFSDVVGVQFKKSGTLIGYLQFETPSMQMNNKGDNMFSENTFTFVHGKNGITNGLMRTVYNYVTDRLEELKYGTEIITQVPDFESLKADIDSSEETSDYTEQEETRDVTEDELLNDDNYIDIYCPNCGDPLSFLKGETHAVCPLCNKKIKIQ